MTATTQRQDRSTVCFPERLMGAVPSKPKTPTQPMTNEKPTRGFIAIFLKALSASPA